MSPETEPTPRDAPTIYVASLSDYNAGRLHGVTVRIDQDEEAIWQAVNSMLARSPEPTAEEFAIHDYEGFGPLHLSEFESIATIARIGGGYAEHGRAFLHWVAYVGTHDPDELERFEDVYLGQWESAEAYADEIADAHDIDRLLDEHVPDFIRAYVNFDVEAFARDLSTDYVFAGDEEVGGIHVFAL